MRLWSIHPKLLDAKGLVACWREALLAQKVLRGLTKGYRHHPQLERFRACREPIAAIGVYLSGLAQEADARGYHFNSSRIVDSGTPIEPIEVTAGQLELEYTVLSRKVAVRDPTWFADTIEPYSHAPGAHTAESSVEHPHLAAQPLPVHPLFRPVPGSRASWEKASMG